MVGNSAGTLVEEISVPSPKGGEFADTWELICRLGDELLARHSQPDAVSVSIGGPLDADAGVIYSPPNLSGWEAVPLRRLLEKRFGRPTYIEHDAKAGVLAEWLFGAGRGHDNLVFLTLGTGLGAGVIVDGHLCRGHRDNAGEVGHWRMAYEGPLAYGKTGSWEAFCSGSGIANLARYMYPNYWPKDVTASEVTRLARQGDDTANKVIDASAEMLGRGIAYVVDLLSPELVVLGSLAVRAGDLLIPGAQRIVDAECTARNLPCPIVPAFLKERLGSVSALCAAIYRRKLIRG